MFFCKSKYWEFEDGYFVDNKIKRILSQLVSKNFPKKEWHGKKTMYVTCRNAVQLYESDSGIIEKKYGLKKDTFLHIAASYNR